MAKGNELFETMAPMSVLHIALEQCEFCAIGFEPEDLTEFEGYKLCDECRAKHKADVEHVRVEKQLQLAMDALPSDELLTLRWMLSIAYESVSDKAGCGNIHKWNNRITSAIASKSLNRKHSTKNHENTKRLHA